MKLTNPIEYATVTDTFSDIYLMHKYWSRKPADVVRGYIEHHTDKGDIILDPFAGSGVVAIEAIRSGRKVVAVDINPVATFITRVTLTPVNLMELSRAFDDLRKSVSGEINSLYATRCTRCGGLAQGLVYRRYTAGSNRVYGAKPGTPPTELQYVCTCSRKHQYKRIDADDLALFEKLDHLSIPFWNPGDVDIPPTRRGTARKLSDFFTRRNLYALALLNEAIERVSNAAVRDVLRLAFSAALAQSSELTGVDRRGPVAGWSATAWIVPDFRILSENVERNVWLNFQNKYRAVWRGKKESNKDLFAYRQAQSYAELTSTDATALILTADASDLSFLPDSSVDYVLTDPPYGGSLQYLPLSSIWAAWLRLTMNYDREISINARHPDPEVYRVRLSRAFAQVARTLRPAGRTDMFFRTSKPAAWTSLIQSANNAGLSIEHIIYQSLRYSFSVGFRGRKPKELEDSSRQDSEDSGSEEVDAGASGDYIFSFRRVESSFASSIISDECLRRRVLEIAKGVIRKRNEPTPFVYLLMAVFNELGRDLASSKMDPASIIQEAVGEELVLVEGGNSRSRVASLWDRISLPDEEMRKMEAQPTLTSRIRETVISILTQREEAPRLYVLQGVLQRFTGPETVGARTVFNILKSCADNQNPGPMGTSGSWVLKPDLAEQRLEHTRLVYLAAKLGQKYGFRVWVSPKQQQPLYFQGKSAGWEEIVDLPTQSLPGSLKEVPNLDDWDVIWFKDGYVIRLVICETKPSDQKGLVSYEKLSPSGRKLQALLKTPKPDDVGRTIVVTQTRYYDYLRPRGSSAHALISPDWYVLLVHDLEGLVGLRTYVPNLEHVHEQHAQRVSATVEEKTLWRNGKLCRLVLKCPELQQIVKPGQFFQVLCNNGNGAKLSKYRLADDYNRLRGGVNTDPKALHTMRIPISVHRIYYEGFDPSSLKANDPLPSVIRQALHGGRRTKIDIVFRVVGHGTAALSKKEKDDQIDLIGPLGNEVTIDESVRSAILVAGGIGFAPLYPVAEKLKYWGCDVTLLVGARSEDDFVPEDELRREFDKMGVRVQTAYETGGGDNRLVTDLLVKELGDRADLSNTTVFMCGPWQMMRAAAAICKGDDVPCFAFLEKRMYCGVGVCMSCVCKIKDNAQQSDDAQTYHRVCVDGPVFDALLVDWDDDESSLRKI